METSGIEVGTDHDTGEGIDPAAFRATMGNFATGVSVMTTVVEDVPHGMTASAVASVSLDPPLVLVCVERCTNMAARVVRSGVFALSFLAADQQVLSDAFADASRAQGESQFEGIEHAPRRTGAPVLAGVIGWVDCRVWSVVDGGDHLVVIGEVVDLGAAPGDPLTYFRSRYGTVAQER